MGPRTAAIARSSSMTATTGIRPAYSVDGALLTHHKTRKPAEGAPSRLRETIRVANWSLLTHYLDGVGDEVLITWTELARLVGPLPASAARHRAWWSGDRPHVRAWRSAGFTVTELHMGELVSFGRRPSPISKAMSTTSEAERSAPHPAIKATATAGADLLLVTCVRSKQSQPAAAKDLYVSPLFRMERAYAEQAGVPWYILSAEYGRAAPD